MQSVFRFLQQGDWNVGTSCNENVVHTSSIVWYYNIKRKSSLSYSGTAYSSI